MRGGACRGRGCPGAGVIGGAVTKGSAAAKARMAYLRSLRGKNGAGKRRSKKMKGGINPIALVGPAITGARLLYKLIKHIRDKKKAKAQAAINAQNQAANSGGMTFDDFRRNEDLLPLTGLEQIGKIGLPNPRYKPRACNCRKKLTDVSSTNGAGLSDYVFPRGMNPLDFLRYIV